MAIHAPIYGSQFRKPAKLYKRFTNNIPIKVGGNERVDSISDGKIVVSIDTITLQDNRYVYVDALCWTETTDKQDGEYQPIDGLIVPNSYITIKYNGLYKPDAHDLKEPQVGDLLVIDGELWMIESPIQRVRHRNLRNMATVYLQLKKVK